MTILQKSTNVQMYIFQLVKANWLKVQFYKSLIPWRMLEFSSQFVNSDNDGDSDGDIEAHVENDLLNSMPNRIVEFLYSSPCPDTY